MTFDLKISTNKKDEIIDITGDIEAELGKAKVSDGVLNIFTKHTTCSLTTADLDPGTDQDFLNALRKLLPQISYNHPHDPSHTPDHILSSIIGPSITITFKDGVLALGTWQRVVLVELDGPRERNLSLIVINS